MKRTITKWRLAFSRSTFLAAFGLLVITGSAHAVTQSELLTRFGSTGPGAGQLDVTSAVTTDPANGHVFVADGENFRIDEFTPWGNFVKAFGWDVAPAGVNEQQEVTVKATSGQFKLTFGASTTGDLEHDASAGEVETALNGLASISAGGGSVSVEQGASDGSSSRYVVAFNGGSLKESDVAEMSAADGSVPLSGGSPTGATVDTRADGHTPTTELESCTAESGCKAGVQGEGAGQLRFSYGITVDAEGNVFVDEAIVNQRVQKFDSAGRFQLMLGGEVNKTTKGNICTQADLEAGDECGIGVEGTGPGEFSTGYSIAIGPSGNVFVPDAERIQEFESNGTFKSAIAVPGKNVRRMAVDPDTGDFFLTLGADPDVQKLSPAGASLCAFPVEHPELIAAGAEGQLFAVNRPAGGEFEQVLEFDGSCPAVKTSEFELEPKPLVASSLATNTAGDLLIGRSQIGVADFIDIYGPPPVKFEPPPAIPPAINAQFATSVDPEDATVAAKINPHFWNDTRYYVEYGTGKCSEGGCEEVKPLPPGSLLSKAVTSGAVTSGGVLLEGLDPATTYHYRFVAQSGGGGPVRGVGGEVGADGAENTFRTPPLPGASEANCPNQAFRTGPSAQLPDCRAYEMVSPLDKNNGDIRSTTNVTGIPIGLQQSATDGESFTYTSYRAFGDPAGGPIASQYLARRGSNGWASENLAPAHKGFTLLGEIAGLDGEFKAFSPDLCSAWLIVGSPPAPAPGGIEDFPSPYRRHNCPSSYEALLQSEPFGTLPKTFNDVPELQGYSADGSHTVFRSAYKLTEDATEGAGQAYESHSGQLRLVCILPNGTPYGKSCSAGSGSFYFLAGFGSSLSHAISEDGSRIYWTAGSGGAGEKGTGQVYLRVNGSETLPVSGTQTTKASRFWAASADGSKALFEVEDSSTTKDNDLYLYALGEEEGSTTPPIAGEVVGVVGQSDDLSYVYFVSKEALGGKGTAGQPNLYLHHEGANTFIATLGAEDIRLPSGGDAGTFSDTAPQPIYHAAQATPDGRHLSFFSTASLTGYDNADVSSDEADAEVYRYAADDKKLDCISCNPGGARPRGRRVLAPAGAELPVAALPPAGENQLYTPRSLSADGSRLYFTAYDALLPRDTNGVADVYEWEAPESGSCTESVPAFSPQNGGCVYLVSSGTSPRDSNFLDVSPDGRDVFFTTDQSLLPPSQDPGLIDVYDARAQGGFPPPSSPPAACEGESCQGPYNPPNDPTPGSSSFQGAGNVNEAKAKKKHAKKKVHKRNHKKANGKRRHRAANDNRRNNR